MSYSKRLSLFLNITTKLLQQTQVQILLLVPMQLIYAYVYYFLLGFGALNFLLVLFVFKPMRKLLHKVQTKFQNVFGNQYIGYVINFSFAIIFLILADSVRTFYLLHQHLDEHDHNVVAFGIEKFDVIRSVQNQSLLGSLKEYREYYMSERNIMLTCSALFVYYVFTRLMFNIRKLADEENMQENPDAKSVLKAPKEKVTTAHPVHAKND